MVNFFKAVNIKNQIFNLNIRNKKIRIEFYFYINLTFIQLLFN